MPEAVPVALRLSFSRTARTSRELPFMLEVFSTGTLVVVVMFQQNVVEVSDAFLGLHKHSLYVCC